MTIEIRQLVIRAVVEQAREPARNDMTEGTPVTRVLGADDSKATAEREAIVATCVREVVRMLRRSRGR
jgi:hypothetical protein